MENWILVELENGIILVFGFLVFEKKNLFHHNENQLGFLEENFISTHDWTQQTHF